MNFDFTATRNPTAADSPDNVGMTWLNLSTGAVYVCKDNTANNSMWIGDNGDFTGNEVWSDTSLYDYVEQFLPLTGTPGATSGYTDLSKNADTVSGDSYSPIVLGSRRNFPYKTAAYFWYHASLSLYVLDHAGQRFNSTDDFTIEFWIDPSNYQSATYPCALCKNQDTTASWIFYMSTSYYLTWKWNGSSSITCGLILPAKGGYHIALTRESGTLRTFKNGVLQAQQAGNTFACTTTGALRVGKQGSGSNPFRGLMQSVILTKGLARYTENFTPTGLILA